MVARAKSSEPRRILVVLPTWIGDIVMATPTLRAIRARFPGAHIAFLVEANARPVIDSCGWMDEVITWPARSRARSLGPDARKGFRLARVRKRILVPAKLRERILAAAAGRPGMVRLAMQIRRKGFDAAVLLPNSFRSALLVRMAWIRRRIGYGREGRGLLLTDRIRCIRENGQAAMTRMVDYYGRLAEHLGCPPPGDRLELSTEPESDDFVEQRLTTLGIAGVHPLVVINPGANYGPAKQWLPERFAAVGDLLAEREGAAIVITCGPGEEALARSIGRAMKQRGFVLDEPRGTLSQLKSLIRRCDLLVNNDTGPRHVAKAFGVPVVTVFGPTFQALTDTDYSLERKLQIPVDCGPCMLRECPLDHRCMTGVTVEMVYLACRDLLQRRVSSEW